VNLFKKLLTFTIILALCVLMLGAFTRLTDAGLGCPDWPGCYGHYLPESITSLPSLKHPLDLLKALTEMYHRYLAGSLISTIVLCLFILGLKPMIRAQIPLLLPLCLFALLVFQAALGMWTVTLKLLPTVVMGHLLGGFLIFASLVGMRACLVEKIEVCTQAYKRLLGLGVLLLFCQIALGGWVSANYAGISCLGFPMCNGMWVPDIQWQEAFQFMPPFGVNYQGGVMSVDARMSIQFLHRVGALVVVLYWSLLLAKLWLKVNSSLYRRFMVMFGLLLLAQIALGIINVVYLLPLPAAVLHNGIAALLFGTSIVLFSLLKTNQR
jgi:cytochrome c oxidase assembly protein subunit 15